jgi:DUF4097 and DUF4098 domain-containing protein YvlB
MSSLTKKILIIAGGLILVGSIIAIIALFMVGFNFEALSTNSSDYEEKSYTYELKNIKGLSVDSINSPVMITKSDDDRIHINTFESETDNYTITQSNNGILRIESNIKQPWYQFIGFNFNSQNYVLNIALPSQFIGSLDVSCISDDISLSDLKFLDRLNLNTTSGNIIIKDILADQTTLTSVSGNIDLEQATINHNLNITATSGFSKISSAEINGDLYMTSISGDDTIETATINGNISLESTSGLINFSNLTTNNLSIDTISGDILGNLLGDPSDYSIQSETISGNLNLPASQNGPKLLNLSTTSGNMTITINPTP